MVKAIVGGNWGDEGKGKITDMFAAESDIVIRFQGGANAGHTIINDYGRFSLHTLPSGVCNPNTVNIIGNGMAFDVEKFIKGYAQLMSVNSNGTNVEIYHVEQHYKSKTTGKRESIDDIIIVAISSTEGVVVRLTGQDIELEDATSLLNI